MCGIVALLLPAPSEAAPAYVARMTHVLAARGPDDAGLLTWSKNAGVQVHGTDGTPASVYASALDYCPREPMGTAPGPARVVLGHRRLAIVDLSPSGHQPLSDADERYWIVHNGEVYNHVELREELEGLGHRFVSQSDTEVIVAAYAAWGAACVERFVGMWAFVIFDTETQTVFASRDPFGIKPLFYTRWGGGLALASEIKALRLLPGVGETAAPRPLFDYLRFGRTDHTAETLFQDVMQLPAGCTLHVPLHAVGANPPPIPFWRPRPLPQRTLTFARAAKELREAFLESVSLHLRSDVPVGAALSGGIDSSAIVLAMRHLDPLRELHAFSFIPDDPALSEERWIDLVANQAKATVHKIRVTPDELRTDLDALIQAQDVPFNTTGIYAQQRIFRCAREHGVPVLLDGQGGDELLAGYWNHIQARLAGLLRGGRMVSASRFLRHAARLPQRRGSIVLAGALGQLLPQRLQGPPRRVLRRDIVPEWLDVDWFRAADALPREPRESTGDRLHEELRRSLDTLSLPAELRFEDRCSMIHSVESRVPFLTPKLFELVASLPAEYLIDARATTKAVFRKAMRGLVPDSILERRDKVGFAVPEPAWLAALAPWIDECLSSEAAAQLPALRMGPLRELWSRGGARGSAAVWQCVNLIRWLELSGVRV